MNHYKTEKATPLGVAFFKSRKWGESLLFSILFLFFLSACTGKKEKHSALPELQTLTFGLMPSFDGLPSLVAVRQGIYDSLDIKIDFITYASATDRDAAFLSGQLDGMLTDYPGATLLQAKGSRLRLVMETDGSLNLIASKKSNVRNPDGLKGNAIPMCAQVVGIVDAYDALINDRPYKRKYGPEEAIRMISNGECGAFSNQLMQCFQEAAKQPEWLKVTKSQA